MPRIVRVGPEYEVLGLSGNYREAELILNIANEALRSLLVAVVVLAGAPVAGHFALALLRKPVPLRGTTVPGSDSS